MNGDIYIYIYLYIYIYTITKPISAQVTVRNKSRRRGSKSPSLRGTRGGVPRSGDQDGRG